MRVVLNPTFSLLCVAVGHTMSFLMYHGHSVLCNAIKPPFFYKLIKSCNICEGRKEGINILFSFTQMGGRDQQNAKNLKWLLNAKCYWNKKCGFVFCCFEFQGIWLRSLIKSLLRARKIRNLWTFKTKVDHSIYV